MGSAVISGRSHERGGGDRRPAGADGAADRGGAVVTRLSFSFAAPAVKPAPVAHLRRGTFGGAAALRIRAVMSGVGGRLTRGPSDAGAGATFLPVPASVFASGGAFPPADMPGHACHLPGLPRRRALRAVGGFSGFFGATELRRGWVGARQGRAVRPPIFSVARSAGPRDRAFIHRTEGVTCA